MKQRPDRAHDSCLGGQPAQRLHGCSRRRAERRIAGQAAGLKRPESRGFARAGRIANSSAGCAAHGDAMRPSGQSHEQCGHCKRCLHKAFLNHAEGFFTDVVGLQVTVKHRRHAARKMPTPGSDLQVSVADFNHPFGLKTLQESQLG